MEKFEYVYRCICNYKEGRPFYTDIQIIRSLMKSLSDEEIELLYSYKKTFPLPISKQIRKLMGKILVRSFPELLSDFKERKKGAVRDTRKKLLATFYYLSLPEKREMLSAFLHSGKMDRRWAYRYIKHRWDDSFLNMTEKAWCKYMDKECAPIILRYSSDEMINRYTDELSMQDYLGYCLRVGKKSSIEIDENRLSEHEYLYVMAKLHRQIDSEKINFSLYSTIASCLLEYDYDSLTHEYSFGKVGLIIWYAGESRCWNELVNFFEWEKVVRQLALSSRFAKEDYRNFQALFIAYSYLCFPAKYAYLLGESYTYYTQLLSTRNGEYLAIKEIKPLLYA